MTSSGERHMFAIPTHRKCQKAVTSIINEMNSCNKEWNIFLVVLDNSNQEIFGENDIFIRKINKIVSFDIYHIGMDKINVMIKKIALRMNIDVSYISDLLLIKGIDYGKMYNLLYICAISFYADVIHRRDSDCSLESIEIDDYPISMEIRYIKKSIVDVLSELEIHKQDVFNVDEKVCIVGGDYAGNWNLDLHELKQYDPDVVKKVLRLSNIPENDIEIENSNNYIEKKYKKPNGKAVLANTFDFEYNVMPECGNICIYEIFRYVPNFIGQYGIGYDYFTYFIAYLYRVPIIFHKNKIFHIHDKQRYNLIDIEHYWIGMYKNIMLDMVYTELIKKGLINRLCKNNKGIEALRYTYTTELCDILSEVIRNIDQEKEKHIINSICKDILLYSPVKKYQLAGNNIMKQKEEIIIETRRDFKKSIELIKIWHDIVINIEQINFWEI